MRTITPELQSHLDQSGVTLAICVHIIREDAIELFFTSNNISLVVDGNTYEPTNSLQPTAVTAAAGLDVGTMDVVGVLSSDSITDSDLIAGKYDRARIIVFMVNYESPADGKIILLTATFGQVAVNDGDFSVELHSLSNQLRVAVGDATQALCRVRRFGDEQCKANLSAYQDLTVPIESYYPTGFSIEGISADFRVLLSDMTPPAKNTDGQYDYGLVLINTGDNAGIEREIKRYKANGIYGYFELREPFPYDLSGLDTAAITMGCDRTFTRCTYFLERGTGVSNTINFRGEPDLPGNSKIMKTARTPG